MVFHQRNPDILPKGPRTRNKHFSNRSQQGNRTSPAFLLSLGELLKKLKLIFLLSLVSIWDWKILWRPPWWAQCRLLCSTVRLKTSLWPASHVAVASLLREAHPGPSSGKNQRSRLSQANKPELAASFLSIPVSPKYCVTYRTLRCPTRAFLVPKSQTVEDTKMVFLWTAVLEP